MELESKQKCRELECESRSSLMELLVLTTGRNEVKWRGSTVDCSSTRCCGADKICQSEGPGRSRDCESLKAVRSLRAMCLSWAAVPLDAVEQTRSASLRAMDVLEIVNH